MTEILIDVVLGHPPGRVWRAITDRRVLSQWFMPTDLEPHEGRRFRLDPSGPLGLAGPVEGHLVELAAPRRLVMDWRGEQLHTRVTWEIIPRGRGCLLRVGHAGFVGTRGSLRRDELRRTYDRALTDRLPAVLDQLAAGRFDLAAGGSTARPATAPGAAAAPGGRAASAGVVSGPVASGPVVSGPAVSGPAVSGPAGSGPVGRRHRSWLLAAAGAATLALVAAAVVSAGRNRAFEGALDAGANVPLAGPPRHPSPSAGPPRPGPPVTSPTAGPVARSSVRAATTPAGAEPTARPSPARLAERSMRASRRAWRASYRTVAVTRSGFRGQVTMRGTGPPVTTAVSITLPVGATVTSASGAAVVQRGSTAIFTVRAATADFTFTVRAPGAAGPLACHLHHGSCTGVSG